jgi:tetratricopeptide (TPR) repeat protein
MARITAGMSIVLFLVSLGGLHPAWGATGKDYFREAYMASMARDWEKAISLYSKAIELDPAHSEAYLQRAAALEMVERIDEAIRDYEVTLKLKPNYYLAMEYLAKLYEAKGNYGKAIDIYSHALPLVTDAKWKSVVRWWMSQAEAGLRQGKSEPPANDAQPEKRRRASRGARR